MAATAQNLLEAIKALYSHPDEKVKKQASEWLEQWQQSVEAWSISDAVLHDRSCSIDAHYFCAQTLRTKVKRDFEELPPGAVGSLRESILDLLLHFGGEVPMVTVQLCLAFAALVAHLPSSQWGQGGALQWLMNRLEGQPPETSVQVMLEMLTILPEEAKNYSPSVRPERRRQLQEEMVGSAPMALQVLASCLSRPGAQTRSQVLEAFAAWLSLTPGAGLPGGQLAEHPLTTAALEGLASPETFDQSVEAMVELIYSTASRGAPDKDSMALVSRLVPAVIDLTPRFARSSQIARAEAQGQVVSGAEDEDDEDTMKGMARLFAEIGEAFTSMIALGNPDAVKPVEALLEVAGHPDADICSISFIFWHRLSRQLNSSFSSTSASSQEIQQQQQRQKAPFYPAFSKLITLIQGRVRYPNNWDQLSEDAKKDFRHSRYAVSDTLMDAASVLGDQRTLQILVEPLQKLTQQGGNFDWQTAEAALQCIRAISKEVTTPNQPLVIALLQSLPQLPAIPRLQHTAALTLGAFAQWMAGALDQGLLAEIMPQLLQMLSMALANAESADAAASAFRDICEACGSRLVPHLDALMQLYQKVQSAGALAASSNESSLDEESVQQIMEAVALLVSALPEAKRRASLNSMLQPVVQSLQQSLQTQQQKQQLANGNAAAGAANPQSSQQILALFDRLTTVLRYVTDSGAVTQALVQIWPLVEAALQLFIQNPIAVERICRTPRYALRTAGKLAQTGTIVPTMMAAVPQWFAAAPHSCFLYLASELVKTFGDVSRQEGALAELLGQLLETACGRLKRLRQFSEEPDIADDTFLLAGRVLSYSPKLLLNNPHLVATLLDSAQAGILVQHRDAGESVLAFVHRLFEPATLERCSKQAAEQLLSIFAPKGAEIFRMLLAGVAGCLPFSRIQSISEAIVSLLQATKEQGANWFAQAVSLLPREAATDDDKSRLMLVTAEVAGRDELKSRIGAMDGALLELSELVCRNRRAQEAAQNALLPEDLKQALW